MRRWPGGALLVSIALHLVLGAALTYVLGIPLPGRDLFERDDDELPVERISFIVTVPDHGVTRPGRRGGDDRPERARERPPPPRSRAPETTPSELPPPSPEPAAPAAGTGPVVGRGGEAPGITPSYSDPRVWVRPGPVVSAPKSPKQRLDSAVAARVEAHNDSLAAVAGRGRKPGDWTFARKGKKYGIDQKKIYLGDISIPTAVLALLPLNAQANPTALERSRTLNAMHQDIHEHAQRAMNEEEFREAVKRIRERKERERQRAAENQEIAAP